MSSFLSIILIFVIILWYFSRKHGTPIQKTVKRLSSIAEGKTPILGDDGRYYYVLANKPEPEKATKKIEEINDFMIDFIIALKKKYLYNEKTCFSEPVFTPNDEFVPFSESCSTDTPLSDFRIRAIYLLVTRYRPNYLEENQPTSNKDTSWAEGKGDRIALCLREQHGNYDFIDSELIKFVALHELTHIAANTLTHPYYFWKVFKFLLTEANLLLGFALVDYRLNPTNYCGLDITYNPVHDPTINITKNEYKDIVEI
jgi:hypothetical protein